MMYDRILDLLMEIDTNRRTLRGITTAGKFYMGKKQKQDAMDKAIAQNMTDAGVPTKSEVIQQLRMASAATGNRKSRKELKDRVSTAVGLNRAHQDYKRFRRNRMRDTGQAGDYRQN
jgi:hypothetical protein